MNCIWEMTLAGRQDLLVIYSDSGDMPHILVHIHPIITPSQPPFAASFTWKIGSAHIESESSQRMRLDGQIERNALASALRFDTYSSVGLLVYRLFGKKKISALNQIQVISAGTQEKSLVSWNDFELLDGIFIDGSGSDTETGALIMFKFLQDETICIPLQEIIAEVQRRSTTVPISELKMIWAIPTTRSSYEEQKIEMPRSINARLRETLNNMMQFYAIVEL